MRYHDAGNIRNAAVLILTVSIEQCMGPAYFGEVSIKYSEELFCNACFCIHFKGGFIYMFIYHCYINLH